MIHTSSIFGSVEETSIAHLRKRLVAKGCGALGGDDLGWGRGTHGEQRLRWIGGSFWCVSVDTTILHKFLSAHACTACTDTVYSKELENDVTSTAMAKAILSLNIWHLFIHRT